MRAQRLRQVWLHLNMLAFRYRRGLISNVMRLCLSRCVAHSQSCKHAVGRKASLWCPSAGCQWAHMLLLCLVMTMALPLTASGHGTCSIDSRSSIDAPVLLQSVTPTTPVIAAVADAAPGAGLAPYSLVEAGSDASHDQPGGELTFAKKC